MKMNAPKKREEETDIRRTLILVSAITLLIGSVAAWWYGEGGSGSFAAAAMGRIGLVLAALWLAWPSLRRPASWLPPGMAVAGVLMLAVLAAQPRLVVVAIPAFIGLLTLAAVVRSVKR
jgi:hypothetical protein